MTLSAIEHSGSAEVATHLKILCKTLSSMDHNSWEKCPTTTNSDISKGGAWCARAPLIIIKIGAKLVV